MKIAVLGTRGFPNVQGGVETHCENIYTHLVGRGCEVTVFTRLPYVDPAINEYKGIKLVPISCPKNKFLEAPVHTLKGVFAASKMKPDILNIHAIGPSLFVPLARIMGLNVVMTHHGPDYERRKWNLFAKAVLRFSEFVGCVFSKRAIAISQTIADSIYAKYRKRAIVMPNGVNIPEYKEGLETLKKYGLKKGEYVLAVGRLVPEKRFDDLIKAWTKVKKPQGCKLVMVGRADHNDRYSRQLEESVKGMSDVVLTGFLGGDALRGLYSNAGLFVLPSCYEGLPIVLLEAMSYGLSCVASDIPANREMELSNDRYFVPGDISALTEKISTFLKRPFNAEDKARQISVLKEKYDWNKIAKRTKSLYKSFLS